jgi:ABC-type transport system involved in cytochrome bd biosynthesis fused ATPase/permease subunit
LYGELNQSFAFTLIAIFALLRQSFIALPVTLSFIPMYVRSFQRVQQFLSSPDIKAVDKLQTTEAQIQLKDASFQWPGATEPFLKGINFKVRPNFAKVIYGINRSWIGQAGRSNHNRRSCRQWQVVLYSSPLRRAAKDQR